MANAVIGNYIHLTGRGYRLYGFYKQSYRGKDINKNKRSPKMNTSEALNDTIGKVKNQIGSEVADIGDIQSTLQGFFNRHQTGTTTETDDKIDELVAKKLNQTFNNKVRISDIDAQTGFIKAIKNDRSALEEYKRSILRTAESKRDKRINPIQGLRIVNEMNSQLSVLKEELESNELSKLTKEISLLKSQLNKLVNIFGLHINMSDKQVEEKMNEEIQKNVKQLGFTNRGLKKQEENIQKRVNNLIKTYFKAANLSKVRGEYLEDLGVFLGAMSGQVALEEITDNMDKYFNEHKLGNKLVKFETNNQFFGLHTNNSWRGQGIHHKEIDEFGYFNLDIDPWYGDGKVDVSLEWKDKPARISMKNYYLETPKMISTGDTNLLYVMQDVLPSFVNHFLNINVAHTAKKNSKGYSFFPDGIEDNSIGEDAADLKRKSRETMMKIICMKTLAGATYGQSTDNTANILVVNDSSTGTVKVFSVAELVDKIAKAQNIQDTKSLSAQLNGESIMSYKIKGRTGLSANKPGPSRNGVERISQILLDMHAIKVHASINSSSMLGFGSRNKS